MNYYYMSLNIEDSGKGTPLVLPTKKNLGFKPNYSSQN